MRKPISYLLPFISEELEPPPAENVKTVLSNPEFHPKRKKLKGWQKENRKYTFNKNR